MGSNPTLATNLTEILESGESPRPSNGCLLINGRSSACEALRQGSIPCEHPILSPCSLTVKRGSYTAESLDLGVIRVRISAGLNFRCTITNRGYINLVANIFITSDPHFGHANILGFTNDAGEILRDFTNVEEMDDTIIDRWNAVVRPNDKIYVLGDIAMKRKYIATIARANGHKRLVRGNHDIFRTKDYLPFFEEIYASRKLENLFLTHIPIHPQSLRYDWINVHGHVHNNVPALHFGPRYINVSTEVTNYTPLDIEQVRQIARSRYSDDDLEALREAYKEKGKHLEALPN